MTRFSAVPSLLLHLRAWPADSQMTARRNAMVACTALAQRRAEREEVEDFLASLAAGATPHAGAARG
jgi:N-dimethylarginine dimethylaminohydrolase